MKFFDLPDLLIMKILAKAGSTELGRVAQTSKRGQSLSNRVRENIIPQAKKIAEIWTINPKEFLRIFTELEPHSALEAQVIAQWAESMVNNLDRSNRYLVLNEFISAVKLLTQPNREIEQSCLPDRNIEKYFSKIELKSCSDGEIREIDPRVSEDKVFRLVNRVLGNKDNRFKLMTQGRVHSLSTLKHYGFAHYLNDCADVLVAREHVMHKKNKRVETHWEVVDQLYRLGCIKQAQGLVNLVEKNLDTIIVDATSLNRLVVAQRVGCEEEQTKKDINDLIMTALSDTELASKTFFANLTKVKMVLDNLKEYGSNEQLLKAAETIVNPKVMEKISPAHLPNLRQRLIKTLQEYDCTNAINVLQGKKAPTQCNSNVEEETSTRSFK